jgi:hypothetical protein
MPLFHFIFVARFAFQVSADAAIFTPTLPPLPFRFHFRDAIAHGIDFRFHGRQATIGHLFSVELIMLIRCHYFSLD